MQMGGLTKFNTFNYHLNLFIKHGYLLSILFSTLCGCLSSPDSSTLTAPSTSIAIATPTPTASTTVTSSAATGVPAARILFSNDPTGGGSFKNGGTSTTAAVGSGLQAFRLFKPDGTKLAENPTTDTRWPNWLTSFEIGVSGSSNTGATGSNCARFAEPPEATKNNCHLVPDLSALDSQCGAQPYQFRVSEVDCIESNKPLAGTGSSSDGIYFRAVFNRANLGHY